MRTFLVAMILVLALASTSFAQLMLDVTLTNGSKTRTITAGQSASVPVQLWAVVTGWNADFYDEGVTMVIANMIITDSGVTNVLGFTTAPLKTQMFSTSIGQSGTANDLNGDGIYDWGSNGNDAADPGYTYFVSRDLPDPIYGNNLNGYSPAPVISGNTTRFLLGTYRLRFSAGIGGAGTITINAQIPTFNSDEYLKAVWYEDNVNYRQVIGSYWDVDSQSWILEYNSPYDNTDANYKRIWMAPNQGSTEFEYVGEAVVLTLVPEPSTLILLGTAALTLLLIRRNRKR